MVRLDRRKGEKNLPEQSLVEHCVKIITIIIIIIYTIVGVAYLPSVNDTDYREGRRERRRREKRDIQRERERERERERGVTNNNITVQYLSLIACQTLKSHCHY